METKLIDQYCNNLTAYDRFITREVRIGDIPLGADHPIRIQSMTTTDTMDTQGTVEQTLRMVEAGCEYVRITAPSKKEAANLENIKTALRRRGCDVPLIADIHFTPNAAEIAARIVEKVRVNPGNYADKKKFQLVEYSDADYQEELDRIYERFSPLVKICKEYGTAMRIGTNHGSLSDRIMSRYGDTPIGMVESALEFVRICEDHQYHDIVLSMKASNTQVMVQAYRLLMHKMMEFGMNYPIHLGVTEAGEGEDGRIKSAVGIGTLLEDGIGDTVRVSLTEEPEYEAPVAIDLVDRYKNRKDHTPIRPIDASPIQPFEYNRRISNKILTVGGDNVPVIIADLHEVDHLSPEALQPVGYTYDEPLDKWHIQDMAADFVYLGDQEISFDLPGTVKVIYDADRWANRQEDPHSFPLFTWETYRNAGKRSETLNFVRGKAGELTPEGLLGIAYDPTVVLVLETDNSHAMPDQRRLMMDLLQQEIMCPVIFKRTYPDLDEDKLILYSSTDFGGLLIDGLGDGLWLNTAGKDHAFVNRLAFTILQATRTRISKTEYISCPSCGRTLFDLQDTTAMIRSRTNHLKGVKIGIMGCIVNGPGEMADADFGYVGSGPGKITLYRGKEIVKRNINKEVAVDKLIELIRFHGMWVDPA